ncbi:MAG: hypothetical protein J6V44_12150 [Methanobrevibacter sp.]|nr:hypothetical protein [Methanobrevibacter sp.]
MKANKVPMLIVRMEGNDEGVPNKWHGGIRWLEDSEITDTPNDNTGVKYYYVVMQSASKSYYRETNKVESATDLSVMLLPNSNRSDNPISFPTTLTDFVQKLNKIARAVYLVSKVDKSK